MYYASTLLLLSSGTRSEVRHGFLFLARVLNFEQIDCIDTFVTILKYYMSIEIEFHKMIAYC